MNLVSPDSVSNAHRLPLARRGQARAGFTLLETMIAVALLGFSLIVMFGFHAQAVRSNQHARRMTACTYLAQSRMEKLLSLQWTASTRPTALVDVMTDPTTAAAPWAYLEHPSSGSAPTPVNATEAITTTNGKPIYYVTWDVEDMDSDGTWARLRVRCQYDDKAFNTWHGTTISSYRFRD